MNKVWKQKWKEQRQYDGHENPGGFGSSVPSPGPSEPHPPLDSQPTVQSAHPSKRSQASLDSTSLPPFKRLKTAAHAHIVVEPEVDPSIPLEVVLLYDKFQERVETDLFRRIRLLDSSEATFPRQFKEARRVAAELGTCAADLVWRRALKTIDENISLCSEEEEADAPSELFRKTKLKIKDTIKHWEFTIPNLDPNSRGFNVTPKFWQLVQILKSCEPYGEDFRGIVFVKHRSVAFAIADLVPLLGEQIPFIRAQALASQGGLLVDDSQQQDVFRKFKVGIYNLLVATKSVEDLDIPKAMIVVRFPQKVDQPTGTGDQIYPRKLPRFWSQPTGAAKKLFPLIITVTHSNQPPHAPLLLLTRFPLPNFPPFKLFVSSAPIVVETYRGTAFAVDNEKLSSLHIYTLRLCRAMANKPFNCLIEEMPYFLAPISSTWKPSSQGADQRREVADHIPWDLVAQAALSWTKPLRYGCLEDITGDVQDAVVQDRSAEMTRRYDVLRVRPDLSPLSHPEDSPREAEYSSLLEYCKAVRKNFEGLKNETQALIEVSSIMSGISRLDPASRPPVKNGPPPPRYLIPELCFKSTVPASTFRTALLFPSITRRFDGFLLVKELNARLFDHQISETLLDQAIAAPSTRIEYDYERLELLGVYSLNRNKAANLTRFTGDAVLKYMASIYVFVIEPSNTEGALHTARQLIISNSALFLSSGRSGLPAYVQSKPFTIKSWQPPNFKISEENEKARSNRQKKENEQRLGDKISADVAEAILGAAYLSGGVDTALAAAKAMNIPFLCAEIWSDFSDRLLIPPSTISAKLKNGALEAVEVIIHHKFEHPHILSQALACSCPTHASLAGFDRVSYERLEFLGDAILEFLVLRHVYERYPKVSPGGLTMLKGAMVSNSTLAAICVLSGLHQHILLASHFANSVSEYISRLKLKRSEEYELARLEERSPGQYWQETDPPKALSDVVESVIGAVYVSDKCSPVGVEVFFEHVLKPFYDKHISLKTVAQHPTKVLFELIQAHKCQKFQLLKEKTAGRTQCQVLVHDVVLASGEGPSASVAARNASWCALDALEGDSEFLRICDCPKTLEAKRRNSKAFDELLNGLEE
ncbi:hypothetical protein R3P38DRAFT_2494335 [Favolaschia claudopus]|uniref:RNase III domain-containing protein n=1 Tax=Favolaschia claudopus TaxID=2862362 RepID=A0AAW0EBR7_9AGAR